MNSYGVDKAITIRPASTANLMVDSYDRDAYFDWSNFPITSPNNLQNGFFTRCAVTEVCLDWCYQNIIDDGDNQFNNLRIWFDISGTAANTYNNTVEVLFDPGNYTVEEVLNGIVTKLNVNTGTTGATFSISQSGNAFLDCSGAVFKVEDTDPNSPTNENDSTLVNQLSTDLTPKDEYVNRWNINNPDLRRFRYIDFLCEQLTYNQRVKDATTNVISRDVLCRWYFCEDTQEQYDGYGYPILMGYKNFHRRRLFNPPKQINWTNDIPVGNLTFQVYGFSPFRFGTDTAPQLIQVTNPLITQTDFTMTLQLSEN